MKKLFIGCGIAVLLLLGGLGFLVWSFWPDIQAMRTKAEASLAQLNALQAQYPFDPQGVEHLDGERFARALELRSALVGDIRTIETELTEMSRKADAGEGDVGFFDFLGHMLGAVADVLPSISTRLEAAQMGWGEFAWHSRVLWAVLYRVDVGAGDAALEPLRGSYTRLRAAYEELRKSQKGLRDLRDVIGEFPPAILSEAEALVAKDIGRVTAGLGLPEIEHLFLTPVTRLEDLQLSTAVPTPDGVPAAPGADAPK